MLKIFLDTEFTGLHQQTSLISLALVAETGEEFYAEFTDYDQIQVSDWIQEHVIEHLFLKKSDKTLGRKYHMKDHRYEVAEYIRVWLDQFPKTFNHEGKIVPNIQIWADCYAWDWVLFCELFDGAFGIPEVIHYMPMDLATLFEIKTGQSDISRFDFVRDEIKGKEWIQHNALSDAWVELLCYKKLSEL